MKYFFDNCISRRFANMLAALEVDVTHLSEAFPQSVEDAKFLSELRGRYDVYLTCDARQRIREFEAAAIRSAGVTSLWLGPAWSKKKFWDQAKWLINRWELIDKFASSAVAGTCAEIKENGKAMPFNL